MFSNPATGAPSFTEVGYGPEMRRIMALPVRPIPDETSAEARDLAEFLTVKLTGTATPKHPGPLKPIQALALQEAWSAKGGAGVMSTGAGKTATALLMPVIWGAERPLIITKSSEVRAMELERRRMHEWGLPPANRCPIIAYEKLAAKSSGEVLGKEGQVLRKSLLERLRPTHIVMDECHRLKASGSTTTARVKAYLDAHPETVVWAMTGTFFVKSIKDASHILEWALRDRAPLPTDFLERETWASFLDARKPDDGAAHAGPGALLEFLSPEESIEYDSALVAEQIGLVRRAVSRRIYATPGIIGSKAPVVDIGLRIDAWLPEDDDAGTESLFLSIRGDPDDRETHPGWRLPDGTEIPDGVQAARQASNAGYGFWTRWMYGGVFSACLTKILKSEENTLSGTERRMGSVLERVTGLDMLLARGVGIQRSGEGANEHGSSASCMESTKRHSTHIAATAARSVESQIENSCQTIATLLAGSGASCATDATTALDSLATLRRASPRLWRILESALGSTQPPPEWVFHRNQWSRWCRKAIQHNRKGLDSEARMKDAVRIGIVDDTWTELEAMLVQGLWLVGRSRLELWEAAEKAERERTGLLEPPSVTIWESGQIVHEVGRWLQHLGAAGIGDGLVWVNAIGLGDRLSAELGIPYYRAKGMSARGVFIEHHRGGHAIASVMANGTGKNLQGLWANNLWLTPPGEQALARTHRPGQAADTVRNWVYLGCPEHLRSFQAAMDVKATFTEQMQATPQKLLLADVYMPGIEKLYGRGGRRWAPKEG